MALWVLLLTGLLVLGVLSLGIGSHAISPGGVLAALRGEAGSDAESVVVVRMRLPRLAVAVTAGLALGAAGAVVQSMTRNPLAEPGLLGVSSGAAVSVALGLVVAHHLSPVAMVLLAMAGAAAAGAIVLLVGGAFTRTADPTRLVLAGAAVSTVLGSVTAAVLLGFPEVFEDFRSWDAGGVAPRPWPLVLTAAAFVIAGLALAVLAAPALDALALGADLGAALGVDVVRTWVLASAAVIVLCAAATSLAGPIGFLALAAVLGARRLAPGALVRVLVTSGLLGAVLLLGADLVGRVIVRPGEMEAGILCALIGAPVFVWVAVRSRVGTS